MAVFAVRFSGVNRRRGLTEHEVLAMGDHQQMRWTDAGSIFAYMVRFKFSVIPRTVLEAEHEAMNQNIVAFDADYTVTTSSGRRPYPTPIGLFFNPREYFL
jgi:hypothetical protein